MLQEDDYDEIVGAIYEAALDPTLWIRVVEQVTKSFNAVGGSLYTPFAVKLGLEPLWSTNADQEFIATYAAKYAHRDIFSEALWRRVPVGSLAYSWAEILDPEVMRAWDGYREMLLPRGVHNGVGLVVGGDDHRAIQLMVYTPDWPESEIAAVKVGMSRLAGHLSRAASLHWALTAARVRKEVTTVTLDMFRAGVAWVSSSGTVLYKNAAMDRILEAGDGLLVIDAQLVLADGNQERLIDAIRRAREGERSAFRLVPRAAKEPYCVTVSPLPMSASALRLPDAAAIVFASETPLFPSEYVDALAKMYLLTPAETRVLKLLVMGRNPEAVAAELGTSVNTVRTQVKCVMAKCNVSRQIDLIRLVAEIPQISSAGA